MSFSKEKIFNIEQVLKNALRNKFQNYKPEPGAMPFHTRLLGKDRMALFSFIHSLNTNFGTSIFEPAAIALAKGRFRTIKTHVAAGESISEKAQFVIQKVIDNLTAANLVPDKEKEIEAIRSVCRSGKIRKVKPTKVDIYLESNSGELFLFDLKTAKPNKGGFREYKRTLLEWAAVALYVNPLVKINTLVAIPYNPYEPKPYSRWTIAGMLDLKKELMVAAEFWEFLGGRGIYDELLNCFERVGVELRPEIDEYFKNFNSKFL